ncbi:glutamine synthetase family protein [Albidovulum sp.]|uniref:glutamine synthetase family protein n=1 Tax=Albidovulum sp. TaxID=1872424 RepID=UPI001DD610E1|nr:glutamine synthetase [Paracoccaceae bacterium]HPE24055.1 glutamine synthetase family protein [Albidovulum sp.]MCB2151770.1 glutamine synthetase [Paracoccaceae bacterium]MCO5126287.1 glutamine synthetase family protein [Paracoccaceae bacterium]MCP5323170.1 glutamine synthetase [Paracoccaceae bacterium]
MPANLTFDALKKAVASGEIDTVLVCIVDMQGRLMGKRFVAKHFVDGGHEETHCCNYLLALDVEMFTVPGYKSASWSRGYGDYIVKPDLSTLRRVPWLPGTAMVMSDLLDHHTHEEVDVSPRAILKRQVARAKAMGFDAMMATELEFFLFADSYDAINDRDYRGLQTLGRHNVDYAIFGTTKEEGVMRAIRNGLWDAGVPIECSKGEAEVGQEEVNAKYSDALDTCDNHTIIKNGVKEICHQHGHAATFMAKYSHERAGSSSHVHQSLWKDGKPAFLDKNAPHGMSDLMRHYVAGQLAYAREITPLLAPYINSYKRFVVGMFAPTKAVWSLDNRTAGFRVCGEGTKGIRVECRIGGADLNPYMACAGLLAAGLAGIEQKLDLEPAISGDIYNARRVREIPKTLGEAADLMSKSKMLRAAFGESVVDHYVHAAHWEISEHNRVVTDWELKRGFERL